MIVCGYWLFASFDFKAAVACAELQLRICRLTAVRICVDWQQIQVRLSRILIASGVDQPEELDG